MKPSRRNNFIRIISYKRIRNRDLPLTLDDPKKAAEAAREIKEFPDDGKERSGVFLLDGSNRVIGFHLVAVGTVDASFVHPREIFAPALREVGCYRVILVHNHPSGDAQPSHEDVRLTRDLVRAGRMLGVHVVDHVIVASGSDKFSSMAAEGIIRDEAHKDTKAGRT